MRHSKQFLPLPILALVTACAALHIPVEVSVPRPAEVVIRTGVPGSCAMWRDGACASRLLEVQRRGILVFIEADSLVMSDLRSGRRVTVRPDSGLVMEVYRGQHRSFGHVVASGMEGAAKGAVAGAIFGLLTAGTARALGADNDVGEAVAEGGGLGAGLGAIGGANTALQEGRAVWEPVTLLQLRQQMCRCADPDRRPPVAVSGGE